ncbi:MAG: radical SAM protein [Deltaproteobacteria bacterium]|nr:radical SAM protein [Deltaproteobacteria bacterium]
MGHGIEERIATRQERVHILTGAVCNNNCIFCMEEDRETRYEVNSQTTDASVAMILERAAMTEEICFTSGEPTTNPRLAHWANMAKRAGVPRVSVMTNGRALSHRPSLHRLIAAGMNRFYVSIHGHEESLHRSLVRTPEAFEQTVEGIRNITKEKRRGIELHTSTVITKRNLPHLTEIYRFLRELGVDQVVFNVMQANGRADTHFEKIFPSYTEIASAARVFFEAQYQLEAQVSAFLVDIPLCTTEGIPDFNRGYVESYTHYEPPNEATRLLGLGDERMTGEGKHKLVVVKREDLDLMEREKRAECATCRYEPSCEGVWKNYLSRCGWDEMQPIVATS